MFIDPLMWAFKQYGRGTDIFNAAHIMLLLMFGQAAAYCPPATNDVIADFNEVCYNRQRLRNLLRTDAETAFSHDKTPLHPRWHGCPPQLLESLMQQV
jgi:ABC-type transport system involved in cytochrome bd biosynthesis fused ATPase/permease subunit